MKILVCGGREYDNYGRVKEVLNEYHNQDLHFCIISGEARGADTLAKQWAFGNGVPYIGVPAHWNTYKKPAGLIRNRWMLDFCKPDLVIAFPGENGTAHMCKIAKEAGVKVIKIED